MKKLFKLFTLILITVMTITLASCSYFGKVQKALESKGYELIENENNAVSAEAENDERVINVHVFSNIQSLSALESYKVTIVVVIEFKATKELVEYYKESDTLQGIVSDIQKDGTADEIYKELKGAGLAHENCIVAPLGLDANNVLTTIKEL